VQNLYRPGTIVSARGREWIVLPEREPDVLRLRPLTTAQGEEIGLFLPLEGERVRFARFEDPKPVAGGDATGIMTLFDAARLSLRAGAGPFRSLGHISVVPRPYQFVPLIMSLRLSPARLLIADDVGVGKTIEAAMIARELLDRGLARRLAVLCPAHLCDQWQQALREKFAISAALVQPSQMRRLERALPWLDISVYQHYLHFVASIDFVKSASQRDRFLAAAPDLVIVDEAHASARPRGTAAGVEHQRYELLRDLARDPDRHILLVTATPIAVSRRASARCSGSWTRPSIVIRPSRSIVRHWSPTWSSGGGVMSKSGWARKHPFPIAGPKRLVTSYRATISASSPMCSIIAASRSMTRAVCEQPSSACGIGRRSRSCARSCRAPMRLRWCSATAPPSSATSPMQTTTPRLSTKLTGHRCSICLARMRQPITPRPARGPGRAHRHRL
jgi:Type III restriction enzyme, res subunit